MQGAAGGEEFVGELMHGARPMTSDPYDAFLQGYVWHIWDIYGTYETYMGRLWNI